MFNFFKRKKSRGNGGKRGREKSGSPFFRRKKCDEGAEDMASRVLTLPEMGFRGGKEEETAECVLRIKLRAEEEPEERPSSILLSGLTAERAKKRVRWPDIEGEKETCFEVGPLEGATTPAPPERAPDPGREEEEEEEESEEEEEEEPPVSNDKSDSSESSGDSSECEEREPSDSEEEEDDEDEEDEGGDSAAVEDAARAAEDKQEEKTEDGEYNVEEVSFKDSDINQLYSQIAELQRNLLAKSSGMERLQSELESVYEESELARKRFRRLQDELEASKRCNKDLVDRINSLAEGEGSRHSAADEEKLQEAQKRIEDLEKKLTAEKEESGKLQTSLRRLETEREEEMQMVQQALDESLKEQEEMERKFGREFERLRTVNANRELQLVEDFEWKLREVQKDCKKQIQEKERVSEQSRAELRAKLSTVEAELEKVAHLHVCEIELKQVRATSQEQKRTLRTLNRKYEELQVSEKILQEETSRLRAALEKEKANFAVIQNLHKEDLAEKERKLNFRLQVQKNQLNTEWEEKLKRESARIKSELERSFREEKRVAVESARQSKDLEISQNKQTWEKKIQDHLKELSGMKRKLAEKEEEQKKNLERAQTKSDQDVLELRRKMDKLDMSYQEQIEKLQETHEKDMGRAKEEWEKRVEAGEAALQAQAGTTRTTLELVKQQMAKEAEARLHQMRDAHQRALERQWHDLVADKEAAIDRLEEKHRQIVEHLKNEIASLSKSSGSKEETEPSKTSKNTKKDTTLCNIESRKSLSEREKPTGTGGGCDEGESGRSEVNQEFFSPEARMSSLDYDRGEGKGKQTEPQEKQTEQQQQQNKGGNPPSRHHHRRSRRKSGKR